MIATFTPNPSFDRTLRVQKLERGGIVRATSTTTEAAGKGVNVSSVLVQLGQPTLALLPIGPSGNGHFVRALQQDRIPFRALKVGGTIRTNISLLEPNGVTTKINEPGETIPEADVENLLDEIMNLTRAARLVVGAGSLPGATSPNLFSHLGNKLRDPATRLVVDTSGPALQAMVGQPCLLLKPNVSELAELVGSLLGTVGDVLDAADYLIDGGARSVLVSMGAQGAVLKTLNDSWWAGSKVDVVRNTVGAGDALLGGFLSCGTMDDQALATGVAWGQAAVQSAGTRTKGPSALDLEAVAVTWSVDRGLAVSEEG